MWKRELVLMMNKKGFTLIELIVVVGIIGVILLFALPNITSTLERNKKDEMINDAKDAIEKAKNYLLTHKECSDNLKNTGLVYVRLKTIYSSNDIKDSPFGSAYDRENSCVTIKIVYDDDGSSSYVYRVNLITKDPYWHLNATSNALNGSNKYTLIKEGKGDSNVSGTECKSSN